MSARNLQKIIDETKGKINPAYDMGGPEIQFFYDKLHNGTDLWDIIAMAFHFGYAMGTRAAKAETKRQKKNPAGGVTPAGN